MEHIRYTPWTFDCSSMLDTVFTASLSIIDWFYFHLLIFFLCFHQFSLFFFFFFLHTLFLYTHRLSDMFTSVFLPSKFIFLISSLVLHSIFFPSFTLPSHYFWNLLLFAWPIVRGFFSGPENIYWKGESCSLTINRITVVEG